MRWILILPFLVLIVLFALSNQQNVHLALWPAQGWTELPVAIAVLMAAAAAFILGALLVWFDVLAQRRRARRAERRVRMLEEQLEDLRARGPIPSPPPGPVSRAAPR
ncbi:MAG: DUF1049 domain-containing protein [Acetobacteraceae bacterium]|nr:DUF1049 domain-containing protein [Acetobacteraceae bacterium]